MSTTFNPETSGLTSVNDNGIDQYYSSQHPLAWKSRHLTITNQEQTIPTTIKHD